MKIAAFTRRTARGTLSGSVGSLLIGTQSSAGASHPKAVPSASALLRSFGQGEASVAAPTGVALGFLLLRACLHLAAMRTDESNQRGGGENSHALLRALARMESRGWG